MGSLVWTSPPPLLLLLLSLAHSCQGDQTTMEVGCMLWDTPLEVSEGSKETRTCCRSCHSGNYLVEKCGSDRRKLCIPCPPGTFIVDPLSSICKPCTQCVGAQVRVKACTPSSDTQCGCKDGLICGNPDCSICMEKCGRGHEPTEKYQCRPCPDGTFNDGIHQKCRPWSSRCPHPDQQLLARGNAFSDIRCVNVSRSKVPAPADEGRPWLLPGLTCVALVAFSTIIIITIAARKVRRKKVWKMKMKTPIVTTPTDDPRSLIAIECSFHEAEQEEGGMMTTTDLLHTSC